MKKGPVLGLCTVPHDNVDSSLQSGLLTLQPPYPYPLPSSPQKTHSYVQQQHRPLLSIPRLHPHHLHHLHLRLHLDQCRGWGRSGEMGGAVLRAGCQLN